MYGGSRKPADDYFPVTAQPEMISSNQVFNNCVCVSSQPQGFGSPSVYHAVIVIFLEFFAWGLLTAPTLVVSQDMLLMLSIIMTTKCINKCNAQRSND